MAQAEVRTHGTVAEQWLSLAKQAGIVIGASAVIAVCARLVLPLPFTPVPLTLANFGVLLVGLALGSKRGLAGWMSERGSRSFVRNLVGCAVAELVLFAAGISWLAVVTGSWQRAVAFGLAPFIFAEVMKVMLAAAVARRILRTF